MRQEDQLINKYGRDSGYRVPDGYFNELNQRIMSELPPYPEAPRRADMTLWQKLKPYTYLAAMFAGIWLMMNMFHRIADSGRISLDNPPESIASAMFMQSEETPNYSLPENDYELVKEVGYSYDSFNEFEKDFGYDLSFEYDSIELPATDDTSKFRLI